MVLIGNNLKDALEIHQDGTAGNTTCTFIIKVKDALAIHRDGTAGNATFALKRISPPFSQISRSCVVERSGCQDEENDVNQEEAGEETKFCHFE
ncbi:10476_t:CDS:1, partial [Ambispora gerdemannii]